VGLKKHIRLLISFLGFLVLSLGGFVLLLLLLLLLFFLIS
jgi:hypothetical protein